MNLIDIVIIIVVINISCDSIYANIRDNWRFRECYKKCRYVTRDRIGTMGSFYLDKNFDGNLKGTDVVDGDGIGLKGLPVDCGRFSTSVNRISGGMPAKLGQFPSYVFLELTSKTKSDKLFCGGTIISSKHILTASHCVWDRFENDEYSAKVYPSTNSPLFHKVEQYYETEKVCRSKKFPVDLERVRYDVAIIKLKNPIKFDGNIQPACLPKSEPGKNLRFSAIGLGATETDHFGSVLQVKDVLQVLPVKVEQCDYSDLHSSTVCFVPSNNENLGDTCVGDSGGGIIGLENNRQTVFGATSYGQSICKEGYPGKSVNANIHSLLDEIDLLLRDCA